ncbi:MAG: M67 family metallopeptidase [Spirochaetia bacterium]|nr:M67 family metallopeptidase [Spirochaetota bacterium]MCX8096060.1 M67 family metallopeptidase [Spirochaetota bacterium]MDW8113234.1 M67 family metallopeptidase [Spirochaetia bacterium]
MKVKREVYEKMIEITRKHIPYEACGVLSGLGDTVDEVIEMENIAKSETFFEMDPVQLMNVLDDIDNKGKDFIGVFHSHPITNPYPSKTDLERNEIIDHVIFVITSLRNGTPELKAYTIKDKVVKEVEINVID